MSNSTAINNRSQALNFGPNSPNDLAQHSSTLVIAGGWR